MSSLCQKENSCVISGIGLATPMGCDYETFWNNAILSYEPVTPEKLFIGSDDTQLVAMVKDIHLTHNLTARQLRKIDRFTILAISATQQVINDTKLLITESNCDLIGLLMGNSFGGWSYVEEQMRELYKGDMDAINSYISTAWFPTAAQGEISILHKIKGYSKTFSAGSISAGFAFEHAVDLLNNNTLSQIIVGGAEAPLTPLVYNSCIEHQIIDSPLHSLCEGAAMFVFEKNSTAKARGSKIYAEFRGCGIGQNISESILDCLINSAKNTSDIDVILLNASGPHKYDQEEFDHINLLFEQHTRKPYISSIKELYGNAIGANMAIDLALACAMLDKQCLPPTKTKLNAEYINKGFSVSNTQTAIPIKNILINGMNNYGECLTLMLSKPTEQ